MKYVNAAEVLPKHLLTEIQKHISGKIIYIPSEDNHRWGEKSGSRSYYKNRNKSIKKKYQDGYTIEQISIEYGLAYETIRKIIYKK
ncbi:CD3324 family protein [Clostridiaceae bacterium M8S5]|nr:CD3324 family protein [Clostridiaceae bacterium M8S5]